MSDISQVGKVIAKHLRQCREEKGWTLQEVADRMPGMTRSRYSNWELGIRVPKYEQLMQLAALYDKNPAWMCGWIDNSGVSANNLELVSVSKSTISVGDAVMTLQHVADNTAYKLKYLQQRGISENKVSAINAPDDSMAGDIEPGDELLIDRSTPDFSKSDIFAIMVNEAIWIRWIRPELDGSYTIAATNTARHPEQKITAEQLQKMQIIGRVARISRDR